MPKRISILPLILAMFVAVSSIGAPMVIHECLMSGVTDMSFSKETVSCCKGKEPVKAKQRHSEEKDACCTSTEQYKTLDTQVHKVSMASIDLLPIFYLLFENIWTEMSLPEGIGTAQQRLSLPISPPAGRTLLATVGMLRL